MQHEPIHTTAIQTIASKATYAGAGTSIFGWLASSEGVAVVGLGLAVLGFVVNLYFKIKQDRRESDEHAARMAKIEKMSRFQVHE